MIYLSFQIKNVIFLGLYISFNSYETMSVIRILLPFGPLLSNLNINPSSKIKSQRENFRQMLTHEILSLSNQSHLIHVFTVQSLCDIYFFQNNSSPGQLDLHSWALIVDSLLNEKKFSYWCCHPRQSGFVPAWKASLVDDFMWTSVMT